jgi:hypothetical protein
MEENKDFPTKGKAMARSQPRLNIIALEAI